MEMLPYEEKAMRFEELPAGLKYPDQVMYLNLRQLYWSLKNHLIDRDTGIREKKDLLDEYRCYKFHWDMGTRWTQILKATELARAAYRKDRTLENADALLKAMEGVLE